MTHQFTRGARNQCTIAFLTSLILLGLWAAAPLGADAVTLSERLAGRIVLQVQEKGKAWYINPASQERAYLGRPSDAFRIMRELGLGITTADLEKISASGDSDPGDAKLARRLAGKILLQVQAAGEAWYINPVDLKRYYLGRPSDAFSVMRNLGLGVSNTDIGKIPTAKKYTDPEQTGSEQTGSGTHDLSAYAGSYRCWSYNVSGGGGGNCRLFAPIVLNKDGAYTVSSEKGTFTVTGDTIVLSESKLRGPGKLISGTQIRFEYDYNNWHHTITYLKEGGTASPSTSGASEVPVQVILQYPAKDSALNGIVTVELVPEGQNVATASYKPTAIAVWDGDKRVTASFHKATNTPQIGKKYTVYTNTGSASTAVGTLDLTAVKEELTVTINVTTGESKQSAVDRQEGHEIVVEIDLEYPNRDSSLGSIQFVTLVPEGGDPQTAVYKPMALAVWDGDRIVVGSFHKATNQVKTKAKYDVYADWGPFGGYVKSGTLDLMTTVSGPITKKIQATLSGASSSSAQ
ncbi:hypothetical protein HY623_01845 [Candidatus Uhrbacteria bacterium]|nr:hypothetical protein [Candidatus Uhrbacteria bacterium]